MSTSTAPECYCNDSSFPRVDVFFSARRQAFVSPHQLTVPASPAFFFFFLMDKCRKVKCCIIKGWILSWDARPRKGKACRSYPKGPSVAACLCCEKHCWGLGTFKDAFDVEYGGLCINTYINLQPPYGSAPCCMISLFYICYSWQNLHACI